MILVSSSFLLKLIVNVLRAPFAVMSYELSNSSDPFHQLTEGSGVPRVTVIHRTEYNR